MTQGTDKRDVYKTVITILMTVISLLLGYFSVISNTNRNDIVSLKMNDVDRRVRLERIEEDVRVIREWVESQKRGSDGTR